MRVCVCVFFSSARFLARLVTYGRSEYSNRQILAMLLDHLFGDTLGVCISVWKIVDEYLGYGIYLGIVEALDQLYYIVSCMTHGQALLNIFKKRKNNFLPFSSAYPRSVRRKISLQFLFYCSCCRPLRRGSQPDDKQK